jgi:pantoate--beta-alanine ligase
MHITKTIEQTRRVCGSLGDIGFVPTMGALHAGHLSLVDHARTRARHVAVSIFVNPTQFGPQEDLAKYPRPLERDLELCRAAGVDVVFVPEVTEIYRPTELAVMVDVPELTGELEGAHRPGHFVGVCRVVAKLLSIVGPRVACFGMKDYQQLQVIHAMAAGLCMPVEIVACPTMREADGLAMSSRNVYLSAEDRPRALGLIKSLRLAQRLVGEGVLDPAAVERAMHDEMHAHHLTVDYATVRDARTLRRLDLINPSMEPVVCLVAGRIGSLRLLDNIVIGLGGGISP